MSGQYAAEICISLGGPLPVHILHVTERPFSAMEDRRQWRRAGRAACCENGGSFSSTVGVEMIEATILFYNISSNKNAHQLLQSLAIILGS